MEKKIEIVSKNHQKTDYLFWLHKSAQERIDALEILRSQYIQFQLEMTGENVFKGFQRVYKITQRK
ncbi:MAG: hypothetical protein SCALA702_17940 [Melioribacteraceae bacterium]|nr:MAG: hypothetical protein SCALA702_17940 [Melioribacteraceae bacterium]